MDDGELLRFKQSDFRQYAASVGFVVDRRESSRGCTVMRRDHEKILVSRKLDGVYTFWSPHDDTDRGTILDFIQHRNAGLNLGSVRKELRVWLGSTAPTPPTMPELAPTVTDLDEVRRRYAVMLILLSHPYLEHERHIPSSITRQPSLCWPDTDRSIRRGCISSLRCRGRGVWIRVEKQKWLHRLRAGRKEGNVVEQR